MTKRYSMVLKSVGNPDFGQFAPISEPEVVHGSTLRDMWSHAETYQKKWDLGGGNWTNPIVYDGAHPVGYFSWNGRLWSMKKTKKTPYGVEISF